MGKIAHKLLNEGPQQSAFSSLGTDLEMLATKSKENLRLEQP
jgi:hypothetical protein